MKNLLGFVTAMGLVSSVAPIVISCNTQQESSYKEALGRLIARVEAAIINNNQVETPELKTLKLTLLSAKEIHWKTSSTDEDYIWVTERLEEDFNDYQHPGFKNARSVLQSWIADAKKTILENTEIKSDEVLKNLLTAISEAEAVLTNEVDPVLLKAAKDNLKYRLEQYRTWNWEDHKND